MADGASPTLPPKEAIALGMKYFRDLMEGQPTPRILLEGLDLDEDSANWIVTFGFDSEREKPVRLSRVQTIISQIEAGSGLALPPEVEVVREFRAVYLTTADGKFVKLEHA